MKRAHGGVTLSVKNDIMHLHIPLQTHLQTLPTSLHFKNKSITLCCIYLPSNLTIQKLDLEQIINQLPPPFFIIDHLNSHNSLWGCNCANFKDKILEQR